MEGHADLFLKDIRMKSYQKDLWFKVHAILAFINIIPLMDEFLRQSRITEGLVLAR
jgi:thiamine phosphate synthase YjbQ (UPF0047 family)